MSDDTYSADEVINNIAAEIHPVILETADVFEAEGITIQTSDPEYKALNEILKDPGGNIHKYRKELYKQIEAKRERLSQPAKPAETYETDPIGNPNPTVWEQAYTKPARLADTSLPKPATNSYEAWAQGYSKKGK